MESYDLMLHEDAARRLAVGTRAEQRQVGVILNALKNAPFRKGDLQETDARGRANEILIAGDWLITFWVDHAVREIRVVRLESAED